MASQQQHRRSPSDASVVSSASTSSLPEGVSRSASLEELRRALRDALPATPEEDAAKGGGGAEGGDARDAGDSGDEAGDPPSPPAPDGERASAEERMERAGDLREAGRPLEAALAYLGVVERFRDSGRPDMIALAFSSVADICEGAGRLDEALQFRSAERMVYESRLLSAAMAESGGSAALSDEGVAAAWERVAETFFRQGNVEMAKVYAARSIAVRRQAGTAEGARHARLGRQAYEDSLLRFREAAAGRFREGGETGAGGVTPAAKADPAAAEPLGTGFRVAVAVTATATVLCAAATAAWMQGEA